MARRRSLLAITLLALALLARPGTADCGGAYDVYFVLDATGSMGEQPDPSVPQGWKSLVDFLGNFLINFKGNTANNFWFITFNKVVNQPCGEGQAGFQYSGALGCVAGALKAVVPADLTWIGGGVQQANTIIESRKGKTSNNPLMIIVTDGGENLATGGKITAGQACTKARTDGANIYVIGVDTGDLSSTTLKGMMGSSVGNIDFVSNPKQLTTDFGKKIVSQLCTEVVSITAPDACLDKVGTQTVTVTGRSLVDATTKKSLIQCVFTSPDGASSYVTSADKTTVIDTSNIACVVPGQIQKAGTYPIKIQTAGGSSNVYTPNSASLTVKDCGGAPPPPPPPPGADDQPRVAGGDNEVCIDSTDPMVATVQVRAMSPFAVKDCIIKQEDDNGRELHRWAGTTAVPNVPDQCVVGSCDFDCQCTGPAPNTLDEGLYYIYIDGPNGVLSGRGRAAVKECKTVNAIWPYIAALAAALLMFLLWFFWPYLVGTIVYKPKLVKGQAPAQQVEELPRNEPAAPPPPPPAKNLPPRRWGVVDTSKYIWRRDGGGARPINVKWGELGPTAMGGNVEAQGELASFEALPAEKPAAPSESPVPEDNQAPKKKKLKHASGGRTNCWFGTLAFFCGGVALCWGNTYEKVASLRPKRIIYRLK